MAHAFHVEMIKPSHYDDDGYVIQWWKASIPSNSLASLYAIVQDAADRRVLGADVALTLRRLGRVQHDHLGRPCGQTHTAARAAASSSWSACRATSSRALLDMAREFRARGLDVVIGGFHVSGCLSMLDELPADLQAAVDLGITLFAGEAEGHIDTLLQDAFAQRLQPIYNFSPICPGCRAPPSPYLPPERLRRYSPPIGVLRRRTRLPFQCSFCTIINVQGRKSRYRTADDVERLLRAHLEKGVTRFFITDDDFARNRTGRRSSTASLRCASASVRSSAS